MKNPYRFYLLAVLVPSALTVGAGIRLADGVWQEARTHTAARAARMALAAFEHDLGTTAARLAQEAQPLQVTDSTDAVFARALTGAPANGLVPTPQGMEVRVALPPEPGDPPGTVRAAGAPLPSSAIVAGRTAGYRTALYLRGQRWLATDPPPGPEFLDEATAQALAETPEGVGLPRGEGAVAALPQGTGMPAVAVLVEHRAPAARPFPGPLLLVMALLLLFSALAGWILLGGGVRETRPRALFLVSLVPALAAWGFLIHGDRLFHDVLEEGTRRDLSRALAVANIRGITSDPVAIHRLSGMHAFVVENAEVRAASQEGDTRGIAALTAPPPSFTSTGRVRTPDGAGAYVALRLASGSFTVVVAPPHGDLPDLYGSRARILGGGLALWLLLAALVPIVTRRRTVGP